MSRTGFRLRNALLLVGLLALPLASGGCGQSGPTNGTKGGPNPAGGKDPNPAGGGAVEAGPKLKFKTDGIKVPFILWGGDVATFHANGGLKTKPSTLFAKHSLRLELARGDDFDKQVKDYLEGKSPFLRGTMSMLAQVSEQVGKTLNSRPVVFLQLTWSAGDHLVTRPGMRTLADLRGKKIALQKGGPHVGMLWDILRTADLKWGDINVVWTDDVTGDKGPAKKFRDDPGVDGCFAITPDMTDLTGGIDKKGDGQKGTVKGAHVLVSTAHMKRSIADVYACRKDFYDANKDWVERFTASYLQACEELLAMRKEHLKVKGGTARYKGVLEMTQQIYGKDDIKTLDDADGLISDAVFVGLPGNRSFFTDTGNLSGFKQKLSMGLDMAQAIGDANRRYEFTSADLDYGRVKKLGRLTDKALDYNKIPPDVKFLIQDTIYSFTISFQPDQDTFPEATYGPAFQRALEQASLFGNAVMAVRGHADGANLLLLFEKVGLEKRKLTRGVGLRQYTLPDGTKIDLNDPRDARKVAEQIKKDNWGDIQLTKALEYFQKLSDRRSERVRSALLGYANGRGLRLDQGQIRQAGAGMTEPVVAIPMNAEQAQRNRRVEFRIIRLVTNVEATEPEIDY
jgi:hypothetical protein